MFASLETKRRVNATVGNLKGRDGSGCHFDVLECCLFKKYSKYVAIGWQPKDTFYMEILMDDTS